MRLRILNTEDTVHTARAVWSGELSADTAIAEALRAELWARKTSSRRALSQRIIELMSPVRSVDSETVKRVLNELELANEITAGEQGQIAAAPLRVVTLANNRFLVAGGPESDRLGLLLHSQIDASMSLREAKPADTEAMLQAVRAIGGIVLTPERWSGLDRSPLANAEWLSSLDHKLAHNPKEPATLEQGIGDWNFYLPNGTDETQRLRWKRSTETSSARLWRARHPQSYWVHTWTKGMHPTAGTHIRLRDNEVHRTRFALDREAGHPITLRSTRHSNSILLDVGTTLPRAEYRYLLTLGDRIEGAALSYKFPAQEWSNVVSMLQSHLGVIVLQPVVSDE